MNRSSEQEQRLLSTALTNRGIGTLLIGEVSISGTNSKDSRSPRTPARRRSAKWQMLGDCGDETLGNRNAFRNAKHYS
jgi:hypothetical protein